MEQGMNEKLPLSLEPPQRPTGTDGERNGVSSGLPRNPSIESQVTVRLVGVQEMATILGVKVSWLYQRTRLGTGVIPFVRFGKYLRFEPDKVIEYYRSQSH